MVSATQVRDIILEAGFKLNPYANSYVEALSRAEAVYGEEGVRTQILYILGNIRARGQKQKEAKHRLKNLSRGAI